MKRIIEMGWSVVLLFSSAALPMQAVLRIGSAQGEVGTRNNIVKVYLQNDVDVHGLQMSIADIPDYLKPDSVWVTERAANFFVSSYDDTTGIFTIILISFDPTMTIKPDTGAILNIRYLVAPDVNNFKMLNLIFFSPPTLYHKQLGVIPTTTINGSFFIGSTAVEETTSEGRPSRFELMQNFPNPFNPDTCIPFNLPQQTHVEVAIFNLLGQRIHTLTDKVYAAGRYELRWNGQDDQGEPVAAGSYLCRLKTEHFSQTIKMVLTR